MIALGALCVSVGTAVFGYLKLARSERLLTVEGRLADMQRRLEKAERLLGECESHRRDLQGEILAREAEKIQLLSTIADLQNRLLQGGAS